MKENESILMEHEFNLSDFALFLSYIVKNTLTSSGDGMNWPLGQGLKLE